MTKLTKAQKELILEAAGYPIMKSDMTTPTQAQIDEIARKIFSASLPALTLDESRVIARVALTTTAAGVDEITRLEELGKKVIASNEDTIERCAQWIHNNYGDGPAIAKAMRTALKEKP
jgi:hypothetical protein